jgi:hypothetical protein
MKMPVTCFGRREHIAEARAMGEWGARISFIYGIQKAPRFPAGLSGIGEVDFYSCEA